MPGNCWGSPECLGLKPTTFSPSISFSPIPQSQILSPHLHHDNCWERTFQGLLPIYTAHIHTTYIHAHTHTPHAHMHTRNDFPSRAACFLPSKCFHCLLGLLISNMIIPSDPRSIARSDVGSNHEGPRSEPRLVVLQTPGGCEEESSHGDQASGSPVISSVEAQGLVGLSHLQGGAQGLTGG